MAETRAWMDVLGYGSYGEYVERLFGFDRRQVRERLRVAKRLEELPLMAAALPAGKPCWSVVRELSRVATPETEAEWIGAVARCTAHDVERLVAQRERGAKPTDKPTVEKPKRVTFEISGGVREELATYSATHVGRGEGCATLEHATRRHAAQPCLRSRPARAA